MSNPHTAADYYSICVVRTDVSGKKQSIEFEGYGLLRELVDDIEDEATKRGWFEVESENANT